MECLRKILLIVVCVLKFATAQDGTCTQASLKINPDADVKFTVILTLRQSTDGQTCGSQISDHAIQNVAVMEWAVNKFNTNSTIKLGFDVLDDCGLAWKSIGHALNVLDGPLLGSQACATAVNTTCQIGIVGTSQKFTLEAILYTIANMSLPVITPFVTSEELSPHEYFYRSVTKDDIHIEAVLSVLRKLELTYIAVVRADDDFSQYATEKLKKLGQEYSICIDAIVTVKDGDDLDREPLTKVRDQAKNKHLRVVYFGSKSIAMIMLEQLNQFHREEMINISWLLSYHPSDDFGTFSADDLNNRTITLTPSFIRIPEVENYVNSKWRTSINSSSTQIDDLHDLMVCTGKNSVPRWSNQNVLPITDAILSFGYALQRQTMLHGCDISVNSVCDELKSKFRLDIDRQPLVYNDTSVANITELVQINRSIIFHDDGEIDDGGALPLFDISVSTETNLRKIGEFSNHSFYLNSSIENIINDIPSSTCSINCETCLEVPEIEYIYVEGDSLLLGIFSVHETDPTDPFKCGEFRLNQLDPMIIESFIHTLELARNDTGINFGALIIDDCYSQARTELVLSQLMSGEVVLNKPNSAEVIDISKILAVISVLGSTVTKSVTSLMNKLNIPVITASASSKDLDDRINYPYFLRTVPSDEEQVKAMISIIQRMSWKYVSLMFVENNYGQKGMESIIQLANSSGICIANFPEGISEVSPEESVTDLRTAYTRLDNQRSHVVVYFGTERRISDFLTVLDGENDFIFLASEDWGDRPYFLEIESAKGSITLKNEVAPLTDGSFADYVRSLNSMEIPKNSWFTEFWEQTFECDLLQSFHFKYSKPCPDEQTFPEEQIQNFLTDQRIVHTVDSVRAVTKGLKLSKDKHCAFEDTFPCAKYFEYVPEVVEFIREIEIERGGVQTRIFKDDGNGKIGFTINNVQENNGRLEYVQVGSFDEGQLNLNIDKLNFGDRIVDGQCLSTLCDHCLKSNTSEPAVTESTSRSHPDDKDFGTPDFTIIGILGFLCLLIVFFGIIIICYFRRRVKKLEAQLKKTCYEMKTGYLTTSYRVQDRKKENGSLTYPEMHFVSSTAGSADDTLYDWKKAQYQLAGGGSANGIINGAFVGSDPYLNSRNQNSDENQNYPNGSPKRRSSSPVKPDSGSPNERTDNTQYVPSSSTSYGLTSNSSFKKVNDSQSQVKKQPRTQLAVPPCRPELPPRDYTHGGYVVRPDVFPDGLESLPAAVPKDKLRNRRGSPKRTVSPPSLKTSPIGANPSYLMDKPESPRYKGLPVGNNIQQGGPMKTEGDLVNVGGSLEKISRV